MHGEGTVVVIVAGEVVGLMVMMMKTAEETQMVEAARRRKWLIRIDLDGIPRSDDVGWNGSSRFTRNTLAWLMV